MTAFELIDLERRLGLVFADRELLRNALVHRSYLNENPDSPLTSNERLEFLGDAAIGVIVAEELYRRFPRLPEGRLTRLRAALVCQDTLYQVALRMGLGEFLLLGHGEDASGGRSKPTNLARAFEALIGAVYLDRGLDAVRTVTLKLLGAEIEAQSELAPADHKTRLQEYLHARRRPVPTYRLIETSGPDHEKVFTMEVMEGGQPLARGTGRSKKAAEAEAAHAALERLEPAG